MSTKKTVKEKHNKSIDRTMTESKFVWLQMEEYSGLVFKEVSRKSGIRVSEFKKKFKETFNVNDYKGKDIDSFAEVIYDKVVLKVFQENGINPTE